MSFSGTITTGGVAQNITTSVPSGGWGVYNPHASLMLWVSDEGPAAPNAPGSIPVPAYGWYETAPGSATFGIPSIYGSTTGQPFTYKGGF